MDFSLHNGVCLNINISNGATVSVTNSVFKTGSNCDPVGGDQVSVNGTGNFIFMYNHLDGIYSFTTNNPEGTVSLKNAGTSTVQYNAFWNCNQHCIRYMTPGTFYVEYNYFQRIGKSPSHGDGIYGGTSVAGSTTVLYEDHDTYFGGPQGSVGNATSFCYLTNGDGSTAVLSPATCSYDTMVVTGPTSGISTLIELNPGGILGATTISNNYLDNGVGTASFGGTAASNYFYMPTQSGSVFNGPMTCTGNKSLVTGAKITGTFSTFGAGWTCN